MKRSAFQVYVKESVKALAFYQEAFDAEILCEHAAPDGTLMHSELDVYGQVLMVAEQADGDVVTGNAMQLCLHFGEGKEAVVEKIYEKLKQGAAIREPLGPCMFSPLMTDLTDKYGVRWCIFV